MKGHIQLEDEFNQNYITVTGLLDTLVFGNLKNQTQLMVKDARKFIQKEQVLSDGNTVVESAKVNELREEDLINEIKKDKRTELIQQNEVLQQSERELNELMERRKELLKKKEDALYNLKCAEYKYTKQNEILQQVRIKNELSSKIVSMRGDLDVGVLICNKEIIPFNMKGKGREERKQYLCDLLMTYDFQ